MDLRKESEYVFRTNHCFLFLPVPVSTTLIHFSNTFFLCIFSLVNVVFEIIFAFLFSSLTLERMSSDYIMLKSLIEISEIKSFQVILSKQLFILHFIKNFLKNFFNYFHKSAYKNFFTNNLI